MPAPTGIGTSQAASQRVSTVLPAVGAFNVSNALNLTPQGGRGQGSLKLQISVPALPLLADTKQVVFEVQDCDTEGGVYAPVAGYGNLIVKGTGVAGAPQTGILLRLHDHVRQFLKLKTSVDAAAGTVAGNVTFETIYQG